MLETALAASLGHDPLAANLTFTLEEERRNLGIPGLSLSYRATWPVNIVLTEVIIVLFYICFRQCFGS